MRIPIVDAVRTLEARGVMKPRNPKHRDHADLVIDHVRSLLSQDLPPDLADFYRYVTDGIGPFPLYIPQWNERVGWRTPDEMMTELLHVQAVPLFGDGCGNIYGLDLSAGETTPAVYFFNHERNFECEWAAGSSLGVFLLLLADDDRAHDENWPERWQLAIDPDLDKCPRARAVWAAG